MKCAKSPHPETIAHCGCRASYNWLLQARHQDQSSIDRLGEPAPNQAGECQVFPGRSCIDRVTFFLKLFNEFERIQADGTIRSTVKLEVALPITIQPLFTDLGFPDWEFWNSPSDTLI